jgi:hypothetical protein
MAAKSPPHSMVILNNSSNVSSRFSPGKVEDQGIKRSLGSRLNWLPGLTAFGLGGGFLLQHYHSRKMRINKPEDIGEHADQME